MMIFSSVYGVVDGLFVSNFVGKTPFAAVNFIMPFLMILGTAGFLFGTGGSALVSKTMGEGKEKKANETFSLIVYTSIVTGVVIGVLGFIFMEDVARLLGAEGQMLSDCVLYGRIIVVALPSFVLQIEFQSFMVTAEKPNMGFYVTLASGLTNMALDALFVGLFGWGLVGAAVATGLSQAVGGFIPLIYFMLPKANSRLHLTKTKYDGNALLKTCTNGCSELMSNISMSLVGMLYNVQLMKYAGEDGVAAYGVMMYVTMVFIAVFLGYSIGTAPVVGFNYGAGNTDELKNVFKKSIVVITVSSVVMVLLAELLSAPLATVFAGYDPALFELTKHGFYIYSLSFLFSGMAIYGSSFFTALNNGVISAIISFLRTVIFQVAAVLLMPLVWETDGIWASIVVAEFSAAVIAVIFIFAKKNKYQYMK